MPRFVKNIFIALVVSIFNYNAVAQKWQKTIESADAQYEQGDYEGAKKTLEKFKDQITKKLGKTNDYLPVYYLRAAKFNLSLGYLIEFQRQIDEAVESSLATYGESSKEHGIQLIKVAEVVAHYGDYISSKDYLEKGIKILQDDDAYTKDAEAKIELTKAEILTGQGFYNESLKFIEEHLEYLRARAVTKESYVDDQGKLKTRKLDEKEAAERLNDYATLLTLKANTLRLKGDFNSADSAFVRSEAWIADNMPKKSLVYVNNQFLHGKLLVENGIDVDNMPKEVQFDNTLAKLRRDYQESHYLAFDLYERLS